MKNFAKSFLQQTQDFDRTSVTLKMAIFKKQQKRNTYWKKSNELIEKEENKKTVLTSPDTSKKLSMKMEIKSTHTSMTTGQTVKRGIGIIWKTYLG